MNTDLKSQVACLHLELRAAHKGAIVSCPSIPCAYDRIVDWDGKLYRVQVKYANGKSFNSTGAVVVNLRKRRNSKNRSEVYNDNEVDIMAVYIPKTGQVCWLPKDVWLGKSMLSLRFEKPLNNINKVTMAQNYIW